MSNDELLEAVRLQNEKIADVNLAGQKRAARSDNLYTGQSAYSKLKPYRCHICAENGKRVAFGELEELREHKIKEHS